MTPGSTLVPNAACYKRSKTVVSIYTLVCSTAAGRSRGQEKRKNKMCLHAACEENLCLFTSPSSSCTRVEQHIHTWLEGQSQITAAHLKCENGGSHLQIFLDKASAFLRWPKEVTQTVQSDCCTYLTFGH